MAPMVSQVAVPDPTTLYRLRDGVYAPDLLIAAVAKFDLFSVAEHALNRSPRSGRVPSWAWPRGRPTCC